MAEVNPSKLNEEFIRNTIESMENTLYSMTYQPYFVAAYVERIKVLKWLLGEIEL